MKVVFLFFCAILSSGKTYSQKNKVFHSDSCRYVLNEVSYFWKLDSLANNGFRLYSHEKLLQCKINNITPEEIFDKLGRPDIVRKSSKGIEYIYYYYNGDLFKKMPGMSWEQLYLCFDFYNGSKYLTSITDEVME
jgi:hypothetical protein